MEIESSAGQENRKTIIMKAGKGNKQKSLINKRLTSNKTSL